MHRNTLYILSGSFIVSLFAWLSWSDPLESNLTLAANEVFEKENSPKEDTTKVTKSGKRPRLKLKDRLGNRFTHKTPASPFILKDPKGLSTEFKLDSAGTIAVYEKLKDLPNDYRPAERLSYEEYSNLQRERYLRSYWKSYAASQDGKSDTKGRGLLPKIELPPAIDRIFGGTDIDFKPNGNILVDIGYLSQFYDDPAVPVSLRHNSSLNFNEQVQVNFQGKIGDKLNLNTNFDSKASFNFQNQLKLNWRSNEEDILQNIEAGNTSWTLNSQLIPGVQNLFGLKALMRFGNLDVTVVAAQQRSKQDCITLQGGSQGKKFEIRADAYDENRHFFLSTYFRNNYERSLKSLPVITSGVTVTRVEVYVTNRTNNTETLRNIVALSDMGEPVPYSASRNKPVLQPIVAGQPADNSTNGIYDKLTKDERIRQSDQTSYLLETSYNLQKGTDFDMLKGAKRLTERDFRFNPQLGYISLITPLRNDEVLAVSYEYTYNGRKYQVGELTENYQNRKDGEVLVLKMLKSSQVRNNLQHPMWNLMMKNVYSLNTSQLSKQNFQLRVIYKDDKTGVDNPNLQEGARLKDVPLIRVLGVDRLNQNGDPQVDGNFDFVEDVTVDSKNGKIIFPVLEPFGSTLKKNFNADEDGLVNKYVFEELYTKTQTDAQQISTKNKYFLKGSFQSALGGDVSLPLGVDAKTVTVTVGGSTLVQGTDFIVDPQLGRVKILNDGISNSGREIRVCYEKPDLFTNQTRGLFGTHLDYRLGKDIHLGATLQHLSESPPNYLRRVAIGNEPVSNTLFGFDASIQRPSRFLTRLVDALPIISTKETSAIDFQGEYAQLIPGVNSAVQDNAFIDDFEAARTVYNLIGQPTTWRPGATPQHQQFNVGTPNDLANGYQRAKISAYSVDPSIYGLGGFGVDIPGLDPSKLTNFYERQVSPKALFPNKDLANNITSLPISVLDVAYFPSERGMYNFNPDLDKDGLLKNPKKNFGAITRALTSDTDFDNANIEQIEFWLMDPFLTGSNGVVRDGRFNTNNTTGGKLVFNLGDVSEDFIPDGNYNFENGIPTGDKIPGGDSQNIRVTKWGLAPTRQFVINAFDNEGGRELQDVGLDGIPNSGDETNIYTEEVMHKDYLTQLKNSGMDPTAFEAIRADPAGDDFTYYLSEKYNNVESIVQRYKNYMGLDKNSPSTAASSNSGFTEASKNAPDREDMNNDNTINDLESYYQYEVDLAPNKLAVGQGYVVDKVTENGADWYLFRVPVKNGKSFGGINGLKSIRFMRMFLTEFEQPVVLRFAQLQVSGFQYRKYTGDLNQRGLQEVPENYDAKFKVASVNIEENGPSNNKGDNVIPYVIPPGFQRDRDITTINNAQLNEQSLSLCVDGLRDGDSRAVFKNTNFDFINYKRLKMFVHMESAAPNVGKVSAFIRIGTDLTQNYYEVEIPKLTQTQKGASIDTDVWPAENEFDIGFDVIKQIKNLRDNDQTRQFLRDRNRQAGIPITEPYSRDSIVDPVSGKVYNLRIVGNPDQSAVLTLMIGVRNPKDDAQPKTFCIWVDELRASGFDQTSGKAAVAKLGLKLADFANVTMNGSLKTYGFGGVQTRISERSRDNTLEYGIAANINLDKLTPEKWGLKIPMYVTYDRRNIKPEFDPLDPDIRLDETLKKFSTDQERENYRKMVEDNSERKGLNFSNVRKVKTGKNALMHPWDIENFSFTYAFSELTRTNTLIEQYSQTSHKGGLSYTFVGNPKPIEPFKKYKWNHPLLRWFKEFNFTPLPTSVTFRADMDRSFVKTQYRNADFSTAGSTPLFEKYWRFNRLYNVGWNLTKSVMLTYSATASAIIDEPAGDLDTKAKKDSVWRSLKNLGRTKDFDQQFTAVWRLPLNKSPLTDWMSADYTHHFGYTYAANSYDIRDSLNVPFGNVIKNIRDRGIKGKIDFVALYNRVRALRIANSPRIERKNIARNPGDDEDIFKKEPEFLRGITRLLMAIRGIQVNYNISESTTLPGFMPSPGLLGLSSVGGAPGFGFITGSQDENIRYEAARNGWLSKSTLQNLPFVQTKTQNLSYRTDVEPFKDFKLQIEGKFSKTDNFQDFFRPTVTNGAFKDVSPVRSGNYSMTFLSFLTAFKDADGVFNTFRSNRQIIQRRLENLKGGSLGEYNKNSQDVLIPAFFAAYSGVSADNVKFSPFYNIPLPNWRLDYGGLLNFDWFKRNFSSATLTHSYTSTYSVGNFISSLEYGKFDEDYRNLTLTSLLYPLSSRFNDQGYLIPVYVMSTISFSERFAPLVGFSAITKSKISLRLDYNQDRNVGLNLTNSQVAELSNKDLTIAVGFTKANMLVPFRVRGKRVRLPNDFRFNCTLTIRDTRTLQRKLDEETVVTAGSTNFQFRPQASYNVNKRLSVTAYFDKMMNNPLISNAYYRSTTSGGIQVKFSLSE